MNKINYAEASLEQVVKHFETIGASAMSHAIERSEGNPEVHVKLLKAKLLAKMAKLQSEFEALG